MTVRAVRNKVQLLSVEQKGRFAIVKEFAVMSVEDCAMKNNATKIKLVPIYTFLWVLTMQELLETKYNCYLWNKKAVLAIVKESRSYVWSQLRDQIQRYKNQTSADLYLWIMSSIPARTVRNEI